MDLNTAAVDGARVLQQIEQISLDKLLLALRAATTTNTTTACTTAAADGPLKAFGPKKTGIPVVDALAAHNFSETRATQLSLSGRSAPFLHALLDHLVSPPQRQTVVLIDLEQRFDATRLRSAPADIAHIHVLRVPPPPGPASHAAETLRGLVRQAHDWMVYSGAHRSAGREWWGTLVLGAPGGQAWTGWRGWLRVDAQEVPGFWPGISVHEAVVERARREHAVQQAGWVVSCAWGRFVLRGGFDEMGEQGEREVEGVRE